MVTDSGLLALQEKSTATFSAKVLADSVNPWGDRLTTFELVYPRCIHSEIMTHRQFCLAGDAVLEFDMPAGQEGGARRVHRMTIKEFVNKWHGGTKPHKTRWGGERVYSLKPRLKNMRIRQLNESTGEVQTSTVTDCCYSGVKQVFEVKAGDYSVAGSKDHKVLTDRGWLPIEGIRVGDSVAVLSRKKPVELKADPQRLKKIEGKWRSTWQNQIRKELIAESDQCRGCGVVTGTEVHHKIPVHVCADRAFDRDNVTLLCEECHKDSHRNQGWQRGVPVYRGWQVVTAITLRGAEETYDLSIAGEFPNFFANKVVVHNSRNAASSRAIPLAKTLEAVKENPYIPFHWGKNQSGMQAYEALDEKQAARARWNWWSASKEACYAVQGMAECDLHKQIANRALEPFMFISVVLSTTSFRHFELLRNHEAAEPHLQHLAKLMVSARSESLPEALKPGEWHLPLIYDEDRSKLNLSDLKRVSTARCAAVSYVRHNEVKDYEKDFALYERLTTGGHWSPLEHVATPLDVEDADYWEYQRGNFKGWKQHRKEFETEFVPDEPYTGPTR